MLIKYCISVFACAAMPVIVAAQDKTLSKMAESSEAVMPFHYESAFRDYQSMEESKETPDKIWRAANDEVGRIGGHAGIMRRSSTPIANEPSAHDAAAAPAPTVPRSAHGGHHGVRH